MAEVIELKTQRLLLRDWRDADLPPFAAFNADPRVTQHFPSVGEFEHPGLPEGHPLRTHVLHELQSTKKSGVGSTLGST